MRSYTLSEPTKKLEETRQSELNECLETLAVV